MRQILRTFIAFMVAVNCFILPHGTTVEFNTTSKVQENTQVVKMVEGPPKNHLYEVEKMGQPKDQKIEQPKVEPEEIQSVRPPELIAQLPSRGEKSLVVEATAYSYGCGTGDNLTATGTLVRPGVIAVDPNIIPYGTKVCIPNLGCFVAEDTGGAIKGNRIDIFMESHEQALQFGRQQLKIWLPG